MTDFPRDNIIYPHSSTRPVRLEGGDVLSFEHVPQLLCEMAQEAFHLQDPTVRLATGSSRIPEAPSPELKALLERLTLEFSSAFMTFREHNLHRSLESSVDFRLTDWDGADQLLAVKCVQRERVQFWVNLSETRVAGLQSRLDLAGTVNFSFERLYAPDVERIHVQQGVDSWLRRLQDIYDADLRTRAWADCTPYREAMTAVHALLKDEQRFQRAVQVLHAHNTLVRFAATRGVHQK
jgi:hypothetical protein